MENPDNTVATMQAYLKGEITNHARWFDELSLRMPPPPLPRVLGETQEGKEEEGANQNY